MMSKNQFHSDPPGCSFVGRYAEAHIVSQHSLFTLTICLFETGGGGGGGRESQKSAVV